MAEWAKMANPVCVGLANREICTHIYYSIPSAIVLSLH